MMAGISDKLALPQDDDAHPTAVAQLCMLDNTWPTLRPLLAD